MAQRPLSRRRRAKRQPTSCIPPGSTGHPKGVIVGQRSVMRLASADPDIGLRADDVILCTGSPAFDATTYEIWATLLNGGRLCVASSENVLDPAALAASIRTSGATVLWLTAGLFHRQIDVAPDSLASLRLVVAGGDKLSPTHVRRAMSVCPTTVFVDAYGPTENTTFTTAHRIGLVDVEPGPIPIGRPITGTRVAIVEASGSPAPIGVWGEIVTGGDGLAVGYLNRPDLTEQAFITDPQHPETRVYHTGDLGRFRSDGVIEFGRRLDDQIKVRGFRVELGEIEQTLAEHPGIGGSAAAFIADGVGRRRYRRLCHAGRRTGQYGRPSRLGGVAAARPRHPEALCLRARVADLHHWQSRPPPSG